MTKERKRLPRKQKPGKGKRVKTYGKRERDDYKKWW